METRTVCLLGQSMLLALVAASLAQSTDLRVLQIDTWEEIGILTAEGCIDVLVYDMGSASDSHILPLLFKQPSLQLIGLDPEYNRAVLLSGKETRKLTLERVKEIVEGGEQ